MDQQIIWSLVAPLWARAHACRLFPLRSLLLCISTLEFGSAYSAQSIRRLSFISSPFVALCTYHTHTPCWTIDSSISRFYTLLQPGLHCFVTHSFSDRSLLPSLHSTTRINTDPSQRAHQGLSPASKHSLLNIRFISKETSAFSTTIKPLAT